MASSPLSTLHTGRCHTGGPYWTRYFRKLLLLYYPDSVVAATMVILVADDYINTVVIDVGMSHGRLFTLYVLLIYSTHLFYRNFEWKYVIVMGVLVGWATLTRPTDALSAIIPLFWGIERINWAEFKDRIALIQQHARKVFAAVVCAIAVLSIQLVYWKYATGHWLYYSYKGQGFSFFSFTPLFRLYVQLLKWLARLYTHDVSGNCRNGCLCRERKEQGSIHSILPYQFLHRLLVGCVAIWRPCHGAELSCTDVPVAALVDHCSSRKFAGTLLSIFVVCLSVLQCLDHRTVSRWRAL